MKKQTTSIDGFSLRRRATTTRPNTLGDTSLPQKFTRPGGVDEKLLKRSLKAPLETTVQPDSGLKRSEIDESLNQLNDTKTDSFKRHRRFFNKKFLKRLLKIVIILALIIGLIVGIRALVAGSKIFGGNLFDLVSPGQPLKADANGRSNIVIFGTSEDDKFEHDGASLTDSILLVSLDQKKKIAAITSVPRDLWVKYNTNCEFGYEGKINVVYECAAGTTNLKKHSNTGAKALKNKIGQVYGIDVQYYIHVNYSALKQSVDAVGGVDIKIDSDDPRGILDRNFDWQCNYQCYLVKYKNGPAHLDGKHALALARARNDAGGYGLSGGNFDREKNQQKILVALRNKAASAGTLANPVAATKLIDSLGNNVRTNFVSGEVKTLIDLSGKINDKKIDRFSLADKKPGLLTTGNVGGQSIVQPTAGLFEYSQIQAYINKRLSSDPFVKENATIMVLNGSARVGAASDLRDKLTAQKFKVASIGNAPTSKKYGAYSIYKLSTKKQPATAARLAKVLHAKVKTGPLPFAVSSTADFVVIGGS